MTSEGRLTGTVVRVLRDKAYGFIKVTGDRDYFFHQNSLEGCTLDDLHDGHDGTDWPPTLVSFTKGQNKKGQLQADDVRIEAE